MLMRPLDNAFELALEFQVNPKFLVNPYLNAIINLGSSCMETATTSLTEDDAFLCLRSCLSFHFRFNSASLILAFNSIVRSFVHSFDVAHFNLKCHFAHW